jgi:hypothetical protein
MSTDTDDYFAEPPQIDPAPQTDIIPQTSPDPHPVADKNPTMGGNFAAFLHLGRVKAIFLLVLFAMLAAAAIAEFLFLGLARRTFIFYTDTGAVIVEERMLRVFRGNLISFGKGPWVYGESLLAVGKKPTEALAREINITRYVEEALLGPVSPNSLPLFSNGTRLRSLLYRNGVVYVDLSPDAAVPLPGAEVFRNLETLYSGIKRNFPYVREIRFFIAGKSAYAEQFGYVREEFPAKNEI